MEGVSQTILKKVIVVLLKISRMIKSKCTFRFSGCSWHTGLFLLLNKQQLNNRKLLLRWTAHFMCRCWQPRLSLLMSNQGGKALKWLPAHFNFERKIRLFFRKCGYPSGTLCLIVRRRTRDGGIHIRPVCWWNQPCACGSTPRNHSPVFLLLQMCLPFPVATAFSQQRRQSV